MICDRCGLYIRPGEAYDTHIPDSMSGARPATYIHRQPCEAQPTQPQPS